MLRHSYLLAIFAAFGLQGCANWASVHRPLDTSEGKGVLIDIKQRAIVSAKVSDPSQPGGMRSIVCAEPSPDALSAYAAQLAAEANVPGEVSAQLAASFQEGSSFVGLRTQSIQLLRDSLYRLCEGYLSGALDKAQYEILMRRYQKYMVALLGIEQITGVVRASAATISTSGTAEAARSLAAMRAELEKIDGKIAALETQRAAADATDAQKAEIDKKIAALKADKAAINKAIEGARGLLASGTATAVIVQAPAEPARSDERMREATEAVKAIVLEVVRTDDAGQLCLSYLANDKARSDGPLQAFCADYLKNVVAGDAIRIQAGSEILKAMQAEMRSAKPDAAKVNSMGDTFKKVIPGKSIANMPPS